MYVLPELFALQMVTLSSLKIARVNRSFSFHSGIVDTKCFLPVGFHYLKQYNNTTLICFH